MSIPRFTVTCDQACPDRFFYKPDRPIPNPQRIHLHVDFTPENDTVFFDNDGRPCDLHQNLDTESRKKIRSRRQTPRSNVLASDE
jgi:hypothetical protein